MDNKMYKIFGGIVGGFVIVLLIIFIISSCSKRQYSYEKLVNEMMNVAYSYFKGENLPTDDGDVKNYSLKKMIDNGKIQDLKKSFDTENINCEGYVSVTNNNGYYFYSPVLNCTGDPGTYKTQFLSDKIIEDNLVETGIGLYKEGNEYIFKGETKNNFIQIRGNLYLITKINADGTMKVVELESKRRSVWDDRYNTDKKQSFGINEYLNNGFNSRVKDYLVDTYNNFSEETKSIIATTDVCIGKRDETTKTIDNNIECTEKLSNQQLTLLTVSEFVKSSLDPSCINVTSSACANYNYFNNYDITTWTLTAYAGNSYDAYYYSGGIDTSKCYSSKKIHVSFNVDSKVNYLAGDGTQENPYIFTKQPSKK